MTDKTERDALVATLHELFRECANDRRMTEADAIAAAIESLAAQPAEGDGTCCHSWHDYGQVNRSWCHKCNALAVTGYEDRPYALADDESASA